MTFLFILVAILVGGALGLLLWSAGRPSATKESADPFDEQALTCKHSINFPYVRQVFDSADLGYLKNRVDRSVLREVQRERHRVALKFLEGLRRDFLRLEEVTSMVATFSAKVESRQEWRRFRLAAEFRFKYAALRAKCAIGLATSDSFQDLAWMVSSLAVELERTVNEIAAGAAMAQGQRPSSQA